MYSPRTAGSDTEELVYAIEDAFGIQITQDDYFGVSTVGDLHRLILSKLPEPNSKRCLTSAAFYRLRRGIVETLGVERRSICPATPLEDVLPREGRRRAWRRLEAAVDLPFLELELPSTMALALLVLGIALSVVPGVCFGLSGAWIGLLFFVGLLAFSRLLILLASPFAVCFPNNAATIGDLARDLAAINHGRLAAETGVSNGQEVWHSLVRLVMLISRVELESVTPEASILDDLGID